jgi:hypothetical protein
MVMVAGIGFLASPIVAWLLANRRSLDSGPNACKPVRRLKNGSRDWPAEDDVEVLPTACVNVGGYSVHAATAIKAHERDRLEELVRYMARPAIADDRIVLHASQWHRTEDQILYLRLHSRKQRQQGI